MSDSGSPLSSPPDSEDEIIPPSLIKSRTPASPTPPPASKKSRRKEPPHVPTFADLPEIAFIVAFQSRFNSAFKGIPNLGCQDIEAGVINLKPSEQVEQLLCRLLGLVLNRKKNVERGHYNRALEDAISANQGQWPPEWQEKNPLSGGKTFEDLDAKQRLVLLKYLILWALASSEAIRAILAEHYKLNRRNDDLNVGLSVQPWGRDGDKRRYWLIEGQDDTHFRLFRESNPALKNITWVSIAGNIAEIKQVAADLEQHGNKYSTEMAKKIYQAIPRFEDGEHKRKRREYRKQRRNYFNHQAAAFSYEGRTRGKRIKYAFSDESGVSNNETSEVDTSGLRRSGRASAGDSSAPEVPRFTASGRQIRKPTSGPYWEVKGNGSTNTSTGAGTPASAGSEAGETGTRPRKDRNPSYQMSLDESGAENSQANYTSRDEYEDEGPNDSDDEMSVDESFSEKDLDLGSEPRSLVLSLKYSPGSQLDSFLSQEDAEALKPIPVPSRRPLTKAHANGNNPNESDAVMKGTTAVGHKGVDDTVIKGDTACNEVGKQACGDPTVTKDLPVMEARPVSAGVGVNGSHAEAAEIRGKDSNTDAG